MTLLRRLARGHEHQDQTQFIGIAWQYLLAYTSKFYSDRDEAISALNLLVARLPDISAVYNPVKRPPLAFLKGILRNQFIDTYRRSKRMDTYLEQKQLKPQQEAVPTNIDWILESHLKCPVHRSLIQSRYVSGKSVETIMSETGMTLSQVRTRLTKARRELVSAIKE